MHARHWPSALRTTTPTYEPHHKGWAECHAHNNTDPPVLQNHIYFDDKRGLHNHLTHHLLAAYALGASADRIRAIHRLQCRHQLPIKPTHDKDETSFDPEAHWGDDAYYQDYLVFFTREIMEHDNGDGRRTVERWMFEASPRARRGQFYARCLTGAYHPLIHLGYGLEFDLNAMIAEGGQVHSSWPRVAHEDTHCD